MNKLVVVLADGLRADTAGQCLGYLLAHEEAGTARWATLRCELPSLSRPLYATLINGQTPLAHGVVSNAYPGRALEHTVFDALARAGGRSAVAAYHWFRELLAGEVFVPELHRHAPVPARGIVGASWYWEDDYPDSHLFADAEWLRRAHQPELLFIHPMGPDHAGHTHGGESAAYAWCARKLDVLLSHHIPAWHAAGYDVIVTSDHGMDAQRMHGGGAEVERLVPLVWLPVKAQDLALDHGWPETQCEVAGFIARRLGLDGLLTG